VAAALPEGECAQVTGAFVGRPDLRGARYELEPLRQILVLVGEDGELRFYRDQAAGPGGYTVRLDFDADSAWVMSRATRTAASGAVADFSSRADLGPPLAIADSVRRRCGVPDGRGVPR
jgi:hypothetical protein